MWMTGQRLNSIRFILRGVLVVIAVVKVHNIRIIMNHIIRSLPSCHIFTWRKYCNRIWHSWTFSACKYQTKVFVGKCHTTIHNTQIKTTNKRWKSARIQTEFIQKRLDLLLAVGNGLRKIDRSNLVKWLINKVIATLTFWLGWAIKSHKGWKKQRRWTEKNTHKMLENKKNVVNFVLFF